MDIDEKLIDGLLCCDAAKFQRVCDSYFRENGFPNIKSYGLTLRGNKTKKGTPDSHSVDENGDYTFFEYTTEQGNIGKKLTKDVESCLALLSNTNGSQKNKKIKCNNIIFVATSENIDPVSQNNVGKKCAEVGIKLQVICINELCSRLKKEKKLIEKEFQINPAESPVCKIDEFIRGNQITYGCDYSKEIIGRDSDLQKLKSVIRKNRLVIVSGSSGVGKTRLVVEFLKNNYPQAIIVTDKLGDIYHSLMSEISQGKDQIVFFDDANNIPQLMQLLTEIYNINTQIKVVLTVRDYAEKEVKRIISKFKIDFDTYIVKRINNEILKQIIEKNFGITNSEYQDRIIKVANGNVRIAVIACEKVRAENNGDFLWKDAASFLHEYYSEVIKNNTGLDYGKNKDLLGVLSTLKRIDLGDQEIVSQISKIIDLEPNRIKIQLNDLYNLEIVDIYHDRVVKVSDQCLQDYFIYDAFLRRKSISLKRMIEEFFYSSTYHSALIESINCLLNVFNSQEGNEFVKKEIIAIWNNFETNNKLTKEFVSAFAKVNADKAIQWCRNELFQGNNPIITDNDYLGIVADVFSFNYEEEAIILIFDAISYGNLKGKCLEIIKRLVGINGKDFKNSFCKQNKIMDVLLHYKQKDWFEEAVKTISVELLKIRYSYRESTKKGIKIYNFTINDKYTQCFELRNAVWDLLGKISVMKAYDVIYSYFNEFGPDTEKLFLSDISNIEKILRSNPEGNKYYEMLIYSKSLYHFFLIKRTWRYMEEKYKDDISDIKLILNPQEDDTDYEMTQKKWEIKILYRAMNDDYDNAISVLSMAIEMSQIDEKYKIYNFIENYILYCNKGEVIDWLFEKAELLVKKIGAGFIYSAIKKIKDESELINRIKDIADEHLKNDFIVAYINCSEKITETMKDMYNSVFENDYSQKEYCPLIRRRIDTVHKLCNSNKEFVAYVKRINANYSNNSAISRQYYSLLFNQNIFEIEELIEMFIDNIDELETAFLNYGPSKDTYESSQYYFAMCNADPEFFDNSIASILFNEDRLVVLDDMWTQKKGTEYATKIFKILYSKHEKDYMIEYKLGEYFRFGLYSRGRNNKDKILEWAKIMAQQEAKDHESLKFLTKIVAETHDNIVIEYIAYLINMGISADLFKELRMEPTSVVYSGGHSGYIERKINHYKDLLKRIDDTVKNNEIVREIKKRIERLNENKEEAIIEENLTGEAQEEE